MKSASHHAHPLVRSLAWLIGSPTLLAQGPDLPAQMLVDDTWCEQASDAARDWLDRLDQAPEELEAHVAARPDARLGRIAESLLGFWLTHAGGYDLLAQNLVVRDGVRTLGEFDFVLRDRALRGVEHWELAVKFYLRKAATDTIAGFVGPAGNDVLAVKAARVLTRQLTLGRTDAGRKALSSLGIEELAPRAFFKGWLFHPVEDEVRLPASINPAHCRGWWRKADRLLDWPRAGRHYRILDRLEWMAWPALTVRGSTLSAAELGLVLEQRVVGGGAPLLIAEFEAGAPGCPETGRGFVVPASWGAA